MFAFIASICPGILYNVEKRNLIWVGLSGTLGWFVYSRVYNVSSDMIFSSFLGAVAVGLYSEILARVRKAPATVFSITGIFPLVPGIAAYNTIQYIAGSNLSEAANRGIETITSATAIAFGILLTSAVFRMFKKQ
jgi:uncharacterized membrane protein YjjB (DUF3815 family)